MEHKRLGVFGIWLHVRDNRTQKELLAKHAVMRWLLERHASKRGLILGADRLIIRLGSLGELEWPNTIGIKADVMEMLDAGGRTVA